MVVVVVVAERCLSTELKPRRSLPVVRPSRYRCCSRSRLVEKPRKSYDLIHARQISGFRWGICACSLAGRFPEDARPRASRDRSSIAIASLTLMPKRNLNANLDRFKLMSDRADGSAYSKTINR